MSRPGPDRGAPQHAGPSASVPAMTVASALAARLVPAPGLIFLPALLALLPAMAAPSGEVSVAR